jgi:hypothetical protein
MLILVPIKRWWDRRRGLRVLRRVWPHVYLNGELWRNHRKSYWDARRILIEAQSRVING